MGDSRFQMSDQIAFFARHKGNSVVEIICLYWTIRESELEAIGVLMRLTKRRRRYDGVREPPAGCVSVGDDENPL